MWLIPGGALALCVLFALEARSEDKSKALAAKVLQDSPLTLRDYLASEQKSAAELMARLDSLAAGQQALSETLARLDERLAKLEKSLKK